MIHAKDLTYSDDGLIPAVVQDEATDEVLMLAYMNRQSVAITLEEQRTCFYSRSRQELWRKGETSGHVQRVVSVTADCDKDALLVRVHQTGAACHTGEKSCFHQPLFIGESAGEPLFSLNALYTFLLGRKTNPKEGSYTNYLFDEGIEKILKKVGEESAEVIIAAMKQDRDETISEMADLTYHLLVLLAHIGIEPQDILNKLESRHGAEKSKQGMA